MRSGRCLRGEGLSTSSCSIFANTDASVAPRSMLLGEMSAEGQPRFATSPAVVLTCMDHSGLMEEVETEEDELQGLLH